MDWLIQSSLAGMNRFLGRYLPPTDHLSRPVTFDIDDTAPALRILDANCLTIEQELLGLLPDTANLPAYHELDTRQVPISAEHAPDKFWKIFLLNAMGEIPAAAKRRCPKTLALLNEIPNLFQAFFSLLEGGKSIPAHCGPYQGYLRYHLGLKIPEDNPPSIRIAHETHTWARGKSFLFDDHLEHEIYNTATDLRVILIVDILRPLPRWPQAINRFIKFCARYCYAKPTLKKRKNHGK